jgi:hypothetical protein
MKHTKFAIPTLAALALVAPALAHAQLGQGVSNIQRIIEQLGSIVNTLIPIVFAIALLVFFWGLVKFILAAGSEDAKETGRRLMIGGLIALFVMSAVWGIVKLIAQTFDVQTGGSGDVPTVDGL